jgi:hypothetical protein
MKTVWKFPVTPGPFEVEMPKGAQVLSVQVQGGEPFMWALVDDQAPKEKRSFNTVGTGHDSDEIQNWRFVGTFQLGPLVFHLFERA